MALTLSGDTTTQILMDLGRFQERFSDMWEFGFQNLQGKISADTRYELVNLLV